MSPRRSLVVERGSALSETVITTTNLIAAGSVVSVQVGKPQKMTTAQGREWTSAIGKKPVEGAVSVGKENVAGDAQANRKFHGGPDKAVCVYCAEHYPVWRMERGIEMSFGAFGENLTIEGLTEEAVCIGDELVIGTVRLQISQPRIPCANLQKRWNWRELPERMQETGWTGFYCRVIEIGELRAGDSLNVAARPYPDWTILRANRTIYADAPERNELAALGAIPILSGEWRRISKRMLRKLDGLDDE
jgi:MOSC domain-containing protein YiiM